MKLMDGSAVLLAAHRGDKLKYPENTMPAFVAANDFGVDMIETDIHMTLDGHLVIMHDRSAKRTAGIDRNLDEMTLAEVKALDAGYLFDEKFKGTGVLTVEEFIIWLKGTDLLVNWELKDYPTEVGDAHAFGAADKLIDLIEKHGIDNRSMVNSFSARVLEHIYRRCGHKYPIHGQGIGSSPKSKDKPETELEELFDWCCLYPERAGELAFNSPENFDYCNKNGIIPCVCLPDTLENYKRCLEKGCKMFTSNNIYEGKRVLKELGVL